MKAYDKYDCPKCGCTHYVMPGDVKFTGKVPCLDCGHMFSIEEVGTYEEGSTRDNAKKEADKNKVWVSPFDKPVRFYQEGE